MDYRGRPIAITGASSGIGAALARALVKQGCTVGAIARRADKLEALADKLQGAAGRLVPLPADVTEPLEVEAAIEQLVHHAGGIAGLINNAGALGARAPFGEYPPDALRQALEVNVIGAFYVTRTALPWLDAAGPAFVLNVSSYLGRHGLPDCAGYIAAKFGLEGLTAALASEREGTELIVASVAPGMVATDMLRAYLQTDAVSEYLEPAQVARAFTHLLDALGPEHHGAALDIEPWLTPRA